jgi:hypothetical protein
MCATAAISNNASNWGGGGGCLGFFVHLCSLGVYINSPYTKLGSHPTFLQRLVLLSKELVFYDLFIVCLCTHVQTVLLKIFGSVFICGAAY